MLNVSDHNHLVSFSATPACLARTHDACHTQQARSWAIHRHKAALQLNLGQHPCKSLDSRDEATHIKANMKTFVS